jgi:hypothetical protein
MRGLVLLFLLAPLLLTLPSASAHQCSGSDCGPCVKGEVHQHADDQGHACNSDTNNLQDAGYNGLKRSPGAAAPLVAIAIAATALLYAPRRRSR